MVTNARDKARLCLTRMGIATPWWTDPVAGPVEAAPEPATGSRRPVRRLADRLEGALAAEPAPVAAPELAPAPAVDTPVPSGTVAPFSLLAWLADGWLVLDVVEGQHRQAPADRQQLATDLLQAFTGQPPQWAAQQCLSWPPAGRSQPVPLAEARDMVQGCIRGHNERATLRDVILLGDTLPAWLGLAVADKPLASQFIDALAVRCLCLPGWPSRQDAAAKRALWRIMVALQAQA